MMDIIDSGRAVVQAWQMKQAVGNDPVLGAVMDMAFELASLAFISTDTDMLDALRKGIVVDGYRVSGDWTTKEVKVVQLNS